MRFKFGGLLALVALGGACGGGSEAHVQKLADYYVPGIVLGSPMSGAVKASHPFEPLPIPGYIDSAYVGPDGVHVLGVFLNGTNARRTDKATVSYVTLGLPTHSAFSKVLAHVTKELGKPTRDVCVGNDARSAVRILAWDTSHGKGVLLQGAPSSWTSTDEADELSTRDNALSLDAVIDLGPVTHQACPAE
jgi:hypothetical protein